MQSRATPRFRLTASPEIVLNRTTIEIFASFASFADKKMNSEIADSLMREQARRQGRPGLPPDIR